MDTYYNNNKQTSTQRTMPTLAAVPAQRTTQRTTQAPTKMSKKRPNTVNEMPATVSVHVHPDQNWRISDQSSNVEYTIYTLNVNIQSIRTTTSKNNSYAYSTLCLSSIAHSNYLF